jgi:hypothetical protein
MSVKIALSQTFCSPVRYTAQTFLKFFVSYTLIFTDKAMHYEMQSLQAFLSAGVIFLPLPEIVKFVVFFVQLWFHPSLLLQMAERT